MIRNILIISLVALLLHGCGSTVNQTNNSSEISDQDKEVLIKIGQALGSSQSQDNTPPTTTANSTIKSASSSTRSQSASIGRMGNTIMVLL